ncbi:MAG TPA: hypothetical protein VIF84_03095 [Candidatus Limnocylindrales bacterium]|jgi:hypothetical protein
MQSSVAAIRRGRLRTHFVTSPGHHRVRRFGLGDPVHGRLVPAMRGPIAGDAHAIGPRHLRRVDRMTWARPSVPARREGVSSSAAWPD